jgi:hypothetical protein
MCILSNDFYIVETVLNQIFKYPRTRKLKNVNKYTGSYRKH